MIAFPFVSVEANVAQLTASAQVASAKKKKDPAMQTSETSALDEVASEAAGTEAQIEEPTEIQTEAPTEGETIPTLDTDTIDASPEEPTDDVVDAPAEVAEQELGTRTKNDLSYLGAVGSLSVAQTKEVADLIYKVISIHETKNIFLGLTEEMNVDEDKDSLLMLIKYNYNFKVF